MAAEIFSKTGGQAVQVNLDAIQLDNPSIIRLQMLRSDIASMERVGNNLVVKLTNGETITIPNFYQSDVVGSEHALVIQEPGGEMWLARPDLGPNYFELANWDELNDPAIVAAGMGMGGILAGAAALGGLGIAAAAGGGGGGGDNDGGGGGDNGGGGGTPDTTAPLAPTNLAFNAAGSVLTGNGEAGATVTVYYPGTTVYATGVVNGNGTFTIPINPPLINVQTVSVTLTDAADNESLPGQVIAPDVTAPNAPTNLEFNEDGSELTGTGEAGATVTVTVTGQDGPLIAVPPVVVGPDGTFTFPISPPLTNGETVTVIQTDAAGNPSLPATEDAPDTTAPNAPTDLEFNEDGSELTGTGEAGATVTVTVTGQDGPLIAVPPVVVGPDGTFTFPISPPLTNGETVTVIQTDPAGNPSPQATEDAPDTTAPDAPENVVISPDGITVTGTGEPGTTVKIYDADGELIDIGVVTVVNVDGVGSFTATLPTALTDGQKITVTLTDTSDNESNPAEAIAPDFPDLDLLNPQADTGAASIILTYESEPLPETSVSNLAGVNVAGLDPIALLLNLLANPDEGLFFEVAEGEQGAYTFTFTETGGVDLLTADSGILLQKQVGDDWVTITPNGEPILLDVSLGGEATLKVNLDSGEYRAIPTSGVVGVGILGTLSVEGTTYNILAEPELVPTNAVGNVLVNDNLTPEQAEDAIVQSVTINNVTTPIPAGTVGVQINGNYGVLTIDQSGQYSYAPSSSATFGVFTDVFTYSVYLDGAITETSTLTITVTHADNIPDDFPPPSGVYDNVAPTPPTELAVTNLATTLTGEGEPGTFVRVYEQGTDNLIGSGPVGANGQFTITLSPAQTDEQTIDVTLTDAAGNESPRGQVTAPDVTPPAPAVLEEVTDFGTTLTGTGEIGSTVTVYAPGGLPLQKIGEIIISADGGDPLTGLNDFTVTLSPAQGSGEILTVTLTDAAGNISPSATIIAPILPNFLPAAQNLDFNDEGTELTGTGTEGSTVTVYLQDSNVEIGTGTVIGGVFTVELDQPINDGQTVSVVLTNGPLTSSPATVVGPDLLIANDNNESAQISLTPVLSDEDFAGDSTEYLLTVDVLGAVVAIGDRYVEFDVATGTRLDAEFTFGQLVNLGAVGDYVLVIEQRVGNAWVPVQNDAGENLLIDLQILGQEIVAEATLGAGEYRASMQYNGVVGLNLVSFLSVDGQLYDITAEPLANGVDVTGNVIEDSNGGDAPDVAPAGTTVVSVTSLGGTNPTPTTVSAGGVSIAGNYGTLNINPDGSYTYTPTGNAANAGQVDSFEYVISANGYGPNETANLSFTIGVPDLGGPSNLVDDSAATNVQFVNVVSAPVTTNNVANFNLPLIGGREDDFTFTVGANEASSIVIKVDAGTVLSVLPSLSVTIYNEADQIVVPRISVLAVADVAGLLGSGYIFDIPNSFSEGTYRVVVTGYTPLSLGASVTVSTEITTTDLASFEIGAGGEVSGNVLANDTVNTEFFRLLVDSDDDGDIDDLIGTAPVELDGDYGTLTIDAEGNYSYTADVDQPRFTTAVTDSFAYGVQQADGTVVIADLDIVLNPI